MNHSAPTNCFDTKCTRHLFRLSCKSVCGSSCNRQDSQLESAYQQGFDTDSSFTRHDLSDARVSTFLMKHGKYRRALEAFSQLQTSPLLASRDFMLTHAQLDVESRTLTGSSGNVIDPSMGKVPDDLHRDASNITASPRSISSRQRSPVEATAFDAAVSPKEVHQRPDSGNALPGAASSADPSEVIDGSMIPDLENALHRLRVQNNPYSYHIGVTGYFKRLAQLWQVNRCRRALVCAAVAMISQ